MDAPTSPHISIIIVNYNSGLLLARVLTTLAQQTYQADRIIVVDNNSQDDSLNNLPHLANLELIKNDTNLGFAKANNLAIESVNESDYLVLLNPDAFPDEDWLEKLLFCAEQNPDKHFFACKMIMDEDRDYYDGAGDIYHISGLVKRRYHACSLNEIQPSSNDIFTPCAGAAMYRTASFKAVGGFDESFFCYMEDVDLGFRMQLKGYTGLYVPEAVVYHIGSAISGKQSHFSVYYGHRNLVWTYFKNMPTLLLFLTLPYHFLLNIVSILFFSFRGKTKTILKAKVDALMGLPKIWPERKKVQQENTVSNTYIWSQLDKNLWYFLFCNTTPKMMVKNVYHHFFSHLDHHIEELLRGVSTAFMVKVMALVLGFIFNLVIARNLGAEGAGLFFIALIIVSIVATIGQFGTVGSLTRFISAGIAENNWQSVKGVYRQAMTFTLISSLSLTILLFFSAPFLAQDIFNKPDLIPVLQLMSMAVLPIAFYSLQSAALLGLKQIRDANIVLGVLTPLFALLMCIALFYENSLFVISFVYVIATFLAMLTGLYWWHKYLSPYKTITPNFNFSKLMKSTVPLLGVDGFNLLLMWNAPLLLGIWGMESDVGIFHVANRVAMLTSMVLLAVNSIVGPKLSECFTLNDRALAYSLVKKSTLLMILISTPIILVMLLFPENIMRLFGDEFQKGADLLVILAIAQFVCVAFGPVEQVLIMSGHELKLQIAFMFAAIASLIASFFLIPTLGMIGAAFSSVIGVLLIRLIAAYYVYSLGLLRVKENV
ncbi:MAG: glycosyltransferase [Gammaproteobacteria bacterium]|nr:glycosyltransferase [Gammaproteobacteria bacterium]